jgi:hypothetical protein
MLSKACQRLSQAILAYPGLIRHAGIRIFAEVNHAVPHGFGAAVAAQDTPCQIK